MLVVEGIRNGQQNQQMMRSNHIDKRQTNKANEAQPEKGNKLDWRKPIEERKYSIIQQPAIPRSYSTFPTLVQLCTVILGRYPAVLFRSGKERIELPTDVADLVFQYACNHGTLKLNQVPSFIHPELQHLNLSVYSPAITDQWMNNHILPKTHIPAALSDWEQIDTMTELRGAHELTHLSLANCTKLSWMAVAEILNQCKSLIHLDLSGCTQFNKITVTSQSLTSLDISNTSMIFDLQCPNLTRLRMFKQKQRSSLLRDICRQCPKLSQVDISDEQSQLRGCVLDLCPLWTVFSLPFLSELVLRDVHLRDTGVKFLIEAAQRHNAILKTIDVSGNILSSEGVSRLGWGLLGLEKLIAMFIPTVYPELVDLPPSVHLQLSPVYHYSLEKEIHGSFHGLLSTTEEECTEYDET
ncbi:hypothetical protein PROFUN_11019 [Planoprotostelium fungivorum]|uniref:Uncharacterized protein n=1 Tax=Planoprotostelium fungivorum TaxID=1890364 RepID=A0A2P6NBT5_9EUKA|nr:hypothetical protein PROFUN_11019 [Planoprotostelium fungivorum]